MEIMKTAGLSFYKYTSGSGNIIKFPIFIYKPQSRYYYRYFVIVEVLDEDSNVNNKTSKTYK